MLLARRDSGDTQLSAGSRAADPQERILVLQKFNDDLRARIAGIRRNGNSCSCRTLHVDHSKQVTLDLVFFERCHLFIVIDLTLRYSRVPLAYWALCFNDCRQRLASANPCGGILQLAHLFERSLPLQRSSPHRPLVYWLKGSKITSLDCFYVVKICMIYAKRQLRSCNAESSSPSNFHSGIQTSLIRPLTIVANFLSPEPINFKILEPSSSWWVSLSVSSDLQ